MDRDRLTRLSSRIQPFLSLTGATSRRDEKGLPGARPADETRTGRAETQTKDFKSELKDRLRWLREAVSPKRNVSEKFSLPPSAGSSEGSGRSGRET